MLVHACAGVYIYGYGHIWLFSSGVLFECQHADNGDAGIMSWHMYVLGIYLHHTLHIPNTQCVTWHRNG